MAPYPSRRIVHVRGVLRVRSTGGEFQTFAPTTWPDQIETGTAYHVLPENHMKGADSDA
jgi:hypothetical protein